MDKDNVRIRRVKGVWIAEGNGALRPIVVEGVSAGDVAVAWFDIAEKQRIAKSYQNEDGTFDRDYGQSSDDYISATSGE